MLGKSTISQSPLNLISMLYLFKNLHAYVIALFVVLLLQTPTLLAQEICNNGIDDDANGLIDLNDTLSCTCQIFVDTITTVASLIPNPSFEDYDCIPSGFAQVSCAQGWIQASGATSDYFHTSGYMPENYYFPLVPTPLPDGNGFVGYFDAWVSGGMYKEYVGSCLTSPMLTGEDYTMQVQIGFSAFIAESPSYLTSSNSPTELCIYGNANCSALPFPTSGLTASCPLDYNPDNWVLLTCVTVSGSGEWVTAELNFTPTQDINAIVLGPNCTSIATGGGGGTLYYYYFLDNLVLNKSSAFEASAVNILPDCSGSALLSINNPNQYALQWYQNGIAIAGATNNQLNLPANSGGVYQVMVDNGTNCAVAQTTVPNYEAPLFSWSGDTIICAGESTTITATGDYTQILWDGVAGGSTHTFTEAGVYTVVAQNDANCQITTNINIVQNPDVVFNILPAQTINLFSNDSIQLNIESETLLGNYSIMWQPATGLSCSDCPNPYASPDNTQTYQVTLTDLTTTCSTQNTLQIIVQEPLCNMVIPNAFSPNDDGTNDYLNIYLDNNCEIKWLTSSIYDRWGQLVVQQTTNLPTNNLRIWDGSFNGRLAEMGVYAYYLTGTFNNNETFVRKGNISLVR